MYWTTSSNCSQNGIKSIQNSSQYTKKQSQTNKTEISSKRNFLSILQYRWHICAGLALIGQAGSRSDTNHRKFTSNVVKKGKQSILYNFWWLIIFFPHSSTLVCEIKELLVEFYFTSPWMSRVGKKYEVRKGGGERPRCTPSGRWGGATVAAMGCSESPRRQSPGRFEWDGGSGNRHGNNNRGNGGGRGHGNGGQRRDRSPTPELVYTIVDPYGFTKSLFIIASALDFLWGRGMVHCRLLAVWTRTHQSADLYLVMVNSGKERPIDFKIYRLYIFRSSGFIGEFGLWCHTVFKTPSDFPPSGSRSAFVMRIQIQGPIECGSNADLQKNDSVTRFSTLGFFR
jgi:hypothetical protein